MFWTSLEEKVEVNGVLNVQVVRISDNSVVKELSCPGTAIPEASSKIAELDIQVGQKSLIL